MGDRGPGGSRRVRRRDAGGGMMPVQPLLLLSHALFSLGVYGILTRRNAVGLLLAVELILNAAALNFERTQAFSGMVLAQRITSADDAGALIGKMLSTGAITGWRLALEAAINSYKLNLALINNAGTSNLIRVDGTTQFTRLTDWNLFGFSYDGSSTEAGISLYRNGVKETPVNTGGTLSATIQGAGEVRIGAIGEALAAGFWLPAKVGAVAVFTGVLPSDAFLRAARIAKVL